MEHTSLAYAEEKRRTARAPPVLVHLYFWKLLEAVSERVKRLKRRLAVITVSVECRGLLACSDVRVYAHDSDPSSRAMSTRTAMPTMTMFKSRIGSTPLTNGSGNLAETQKSTPARLWSRIRVNEWTFSLMLFTFSLAIIVAKLYLNYCGKLLSWQAGDRYSLPSVAFTQMYVTIRRAIADILIAFYSRFGWLLKATMSGLVITGFTWFILYKDSSIPGINPPSPFSPSKQRIHGSSRIQINYLVGALNGILFFIYMCL
ncbi:PREDICTED: uncharacterized protein LOC108757742 isoform X2 [Trachymyrmex cornetzi]|uniref:uncharacterized protein LOC108757742 isoform X2 n=1 Tax=Trachymyrmex cornetzi TaxID=471704 RepID=UPI00084EE05A|nr:PREDICTED: uncharacterized protein LOC108757742 isoform X2 [Trachymyrmex cornetzi]